MIDKDTLLHKLRHASPVQQEQIYVMIRTHPFPGTNPMRLDLPFGGKQMKKGVKFDLDKFPTTLIRQLNEYLK